MEFHEVKNYIHNLYSNLSTGILIWVNYLYGWRLLGKSVTDGVMFKFDDVMNLTTLKMWLKLLSVKRALFENGFLPHVIFNYSVFELYQMFVNNHLLYELFHERKLLSAD